MNYVFSQKLNHPVNYTIVYLFTLLAMLCLLALWPYIRETMVVAWLPHIDNAQDVALFFSILMVACFGITVLVLKSRFHTLEAARGVDNHAALHDSLTGAANRRQFAIRLNNF